MPVLTFTAVVTGKLDNIDGARADYKNGVIFGWADAEERLNTLEDNISIGGTN